MRFLILRRRKLGVAIPADQLRKMQPLAGDIQISECLSDSLGRSTISAWIFGSGPGPDVFPRLLDVKITGMAQVGMNLTGIKRRWTAPSMRSHGGAGLSRGLGGWPRPAPPAWLMEPHEASLPQRLLNELSPSAMPAIKGCYFASVPEYR